MSNIKHLHHILLLIFQFTFYISGYSEPYKTQNDSINMNYNETQWSLNKILSKPEKSFKNLSVIYEQSLAQKDTNSVIHCLISLGDIERFRGNYEASFDFLWDALMFANKSKDQINLIKINRNLGILYDIYNKDSLALEYLLEALHLSKQLDSNKKIQKHENVACYFSIASHYRDKKQYNIALNYLDSCSLVYDKNKRQPFVQADKGFIYLKKGQLDLAEKNLFEAKAEIHRKEEKYHIVLLSFIGDLKIAQHQPDSAIYYFSKSIEELEKSNAHLEYKPQLLEKLASLYLEKGKHLKAYRYLEASKACSDSLFSTTNQRNNKLFEIKNKYKESFAKQEAFIEQQNNVIAEKNRMVLVLGIVIGLVALLSISFFMYAQQKTANKKQALTHQLETDKNNAVLDLKSKELTTYTLQMIEKEEAVKELLEVIKKHAPSSFNTLRTKYTKVSKNLWEDFNMRFVEVNGDFYDCLREKHPNLTSTEQKHCALIRLNLDNNEMAQILNISLQSVHTSRYRIRKKIGLAHGESLSNYIGSLKKESL